MQISPTLFYRSGHYDDLQSAQEKAKKTSKGIFSSKDASSRRIVDLAGDVTKSKAFLPFLTRAGRMQGVVEFVASGSRFRIYIPRETSVITFLLAGKISLKNYKQTAVIQNVNKSLHFQESHVPELPDQESVMPNLLVMRL